MLFTLVRIYKQDDVWCYDLIVKNRKCQEFIASLIEHAPEERVGLNGREFKIFLKWLKLLRN